MRPQRVALGGDTPRIGQSYPTERVSPAPPGRAYRHRSTGVKRHPARQLAETLKQTVQRDEKLLRIVRVRRVREGADSLETVRFQDRDQLVSLDAAQV